MVVGDARGELDERDDAGASAALADRLTSLFAVDDPARAGIYLASRNAGAATSVHFWSEARRHGLGFASPELFPWTLANGPAALLARRFRIMGPNATFTGRAEALRAALTHAADDLSAARIATAFVIAIDFADATSPTRYAAVRLTAAPALSIERGDPDTTAVAALAALIDGGTR